LDGGSARRKAITYTRDNITQNKSDMNQRLKLPKTARALDRATSVIGHFNPLLYVPSVAGFRNRDSKP